MKASAELYDSDRCVALCHARSQLVPSPHDDIEHRQLVTRLLRVLSPRQERVIRLCYGIGTPAAGLSVIAEAFCVTPQRIDQIRLDALLRMRRIAVTLDTAGDEPLDSPFRRRPQARALRGVGDRSQPPAMRTRTVRPPRAAPPKRAPRRRWHARETSRYEPTAATVSPSCLPPPSMPIVEPELPSTTAPHDEVAVSMRPMLLWLLPLLLLAALWHHAR